MSQWSTISSAWPTRQGWCALKNASYCGVINHVQSCSFPLRSSRVLSTIAAEQQLAEACFAEPATGDGDILLWYGALHKFK